MEKWEIKDYFTLENTTGYTQKKLNEMNEELLDTIEHDENGEYDVQLVKHYAEKIQQAN